MKIKDWKNWASKQPIEKLEKIENALDILYQDETIHHEFEPLNFWILRNIVKYEKQKKEKSKQKVKEVV